MMMGSYLTDALKTLKARRFGATVNPLQMRALVEFEQYLMGEQQPTWGKR